METEIKKVELPKKEPSTAYTALGMAMLFGIPFCVWWVYSENVSRDAQMKRELIRQVNWVVSDNDVKMYKTNQNQNLKNSADQIQNRYNKPIWMHVEEDKSGKGVIVIRP